MDDVYFKTNYENGLIYTHEVKIIINNNVI